MYVSEMTKNCGLLNWMTNMEVAHAVADAPLGPFTKRDTALPAMSTNPEVIVDDKGDWWMFHIGEGDNHTVQRDCRNQSAMHAVGGAKGTGMHAVGDATGTAIQVVHHALGPDGPWRPQPSVDCNNPSPALARLDSKREARLTPKREARLTSKREARLEGEANREARLEPEAGLISNREARLMCTWTVQTSKYGFGGPWGDPIPVPIADDRKG